VCDQHPERDRDSDVSLHEQPGTTTTADEVRQQQRAARAADDKRRAKKARKRRRRAGRDVQRWSLVLFTCVLTTVGVRQCDTMDAQTAAMKQQSHVMAQQRLVMARQTRIADKQREMMVANQRAWVLLERIEERVSPKPSERGVTLVFKNFGNSPALNVGFTHNVGTGKVEPPPPECAACLGIALGPGQTHEERFTVTKNFTREAPGWVTGAAFYTDGFGTVGHAAFCKSWVYEEEISNFLIEDCGAIAR
jgi:hypothetical protein